MIQGYNYGISTKIMKEQVEWRMYWLWIWAPPADG